MTPEQLLDFNAIQELEAQIGRARLERIVGIQLRHGRALIEQLGALDGASDPQMVRLLAHQIAGSCSSIGMMPLSDAATHLETLVMSGTDANLVTLVEALRLLAVASHDALEAAFPKTD